MWVKTQGQAYSGHSFLLFCFTQRLRLSWELYPRILSGIFLAHPLMVSTWFCRGLQYDYNSSSVQFSSVQLLSRVFATPWIAARQASLSITNSWSSLRFTSIKSVMPSSHLILCCPLLFLPPIPPSIRVFSNESTLRIRWPKYWSFSFSIIPSKEHPGLIAFGIQDSLRHWKCLLKPLGSQGWTEIIKANDGFGF